MPRTIVLFILIGLFLKGQSQQVSDTSYHPEISNPRYAANSGPTILIDEGHHNFHTRTGRYEPFAKLIERDGYRVGSYNGAFQIDKLQKCDILVISNALHKSNVRNWYIPVYSAFSNNEIEHIVKWVSAGGSLFLIADHMPMAGAAKDLAAAFGFEFFDGFALKMNDTGPSEFTVENNTLMEGPLTNGRFPDERVDKVLSFTGQAFLIPADAHAVLKMDDSHVMLLPDTAWQFHQATPIMEIEGWSQGAYKNFGKGRIVVFGEAAMFTAQVVLPQNIKAGMNVDGAEQNYQLLLNIIHWLDGNNDHMPPPFSDTPFH